MNSALKMIAFYLLGILSLYAYLGYKRDPFLINEAHYAFRLLPNGRVQCVENSDGMNVLVEGEIQLEDAIFAPREVRP